MRNEKPQVPGKDQEDHTILNLIFLLGFTAGLVYILSNRKTRARIISKLKAKKKDDAAAPQKNGADNIDIEIRYDTPVDVEAASLAKNMVKVIKMVLVPLESDIQKEQAKLIFLYGGDFWEMRMCNATPRLKNNVRTLLEAREW